MDSALDNLFSTFKHKHIRYCHWKSNEHLSESFHGETDLDILANPQDKESVTRILRENQAIRVHSPKWAQYDDVEDWLLLDPNSGTMFHLHLHYRLIIGKRFAKEIELPWVQDILDSATIDSDYSIKITEPHREMILLLLRIGTKSTLINLMRNYLKDNPLLPDNIDNELQYLREQTNQDILESQVEKWLNTEDAPVLLSGNKLLHNTKANTLSNLLQLWQFHLSVSRILKPYQTSSSLTALCKYWRGTILMRFRISRQTKKTLPSNGFLVSVLGADGSGKSTLVVALARQFGWKLEVRKVYLGRHWIFPLLGNIKRKLKKTTSAGHNPQNTFVPAANTTTKDLIHLINAHHRYRAIKKINTYTKKGFFVVTDRFPQTEHLGINDSPSILNQESYLGKLERKLYQQMTQTQPDLVIKLQVSSTTAINRKPDHSIKEVQKKIDIINNLNFSKSVSAEIDTDSHSIKEIQISAKKAIWRAILKKYE